MLTADFFAPPARIWKTRFPYTRTIALAFMFAAGIALTLYAVLAYERAYPKFQPWDVHMEPLTRFSVELPATPEFFGVSEVQAIRHTTLTRETYRVQVFRLRLSHRFSSLGSPDSRSVAEKIRYYNVPTKVRPRYDVSEVSAAAEYEQWVTTRVISVSRVLIVDDLVYEMSVTGSFLSWDDYRVRQFFDSLHPMKLRGTEEKALVPE
jgi:hypothetical protein